MKHTITAIVPMRHNSERVPQKNFKPFNGKPLYHYVVESLLACPSISKVVIDTDSPTIMEDAAACFPQALVLERPPHLRDGAIPMNDVLLNTIGQVESDFYLQTHSTNPLLKPETIQAGIERFLGSYPIYDSLFSVTRVQSRFWDQLGRAINHNPNILLRTQDLPPIYEENSCLYIFTKEILARKHNRIGDRPFLFEMSAREAIDIDEPIDFEVAELMHKALRKQ